MSTGPMSVSDWAEANANVHGVRFDTITGADWARELAAARRHRIERRAKVTAFVAEQERLRLTTILIVGADMGALRPVGSLPIVVLDELEAHL